MTKYISLILIIACISQMSYAQERDSVKTAKVEDSFENQAPDTTTVQVGEKEVKIIEEDGETVVLVEELEEIKEEIKREIEEEMEEKEKDWDFSFDKDDDDSHGKFKGHWSGFEIGLNNYVNSSNSLTRNDENEFLDLNTARSWNVNFNFAQYSIPTIGDRFGFVTGMGLEWSNYHFSNNNTIIKNTVLGTIEEIPLTGSIKKNRLQTMYLTVPVLMELQLLKGSRSDRLHLSGGLIAGLKLRSATKIKVSENGGTSSNKDKSDYYLTPLRYGVTARAGYKLVKLYFNYYLTPLFIENRGPELYPVALGLAFTF